MFVESLVRELYQSSVERSLLLSGLVGYERDGRSFRIEYAPEDICSQVHILGPEEPVAGAPALCQANTGLKTIR